MPRQNNRDIQINSLLEKRAVARFKKASAPKKGTKPYHVPGDSNNTTFFCSTPEKGKVSVDKYLNEHKKYWL